MAKTETMTLDDLRRALVMERLDPPEDCALVFGGDEWDDDCGCIACVEERCYRIMPLEVRR